MKDKIRSDTNMLDQIKKILIQFLSEVFRNSFPSDMEISDAPYNENVQTFFFFFWYHEK